MKKTAIASVRPGDVVSRPVVTPGGVVLLQPGATLTAEHISRLAERGVAVVWVEGEADGAPTRAELLADLDRRFAEHEADPLMMELKAIVASLVEPGPVDCRDR
jgi:hypothetical protein